MREVDFKYLKSALKSLDSSTDLVLVRGCVAATLSHQCSPYASRREVKYKEIEPIAPDGVIVAANLRKILLVGLSSREVKHAKEVIWQGFRPDYRPFEDGQFGWYGPRAWWVSEPVPTTMKHLFSIVKCAHDYGLVGSEWFREPLLHVAWLVPYVIGWDECGQPIFDWPECSSDSESESESEPADQDLPVEV